MAGPAAPGADGPRHSLEAILADGARELGCLRSLSRLIDTRGLSVAEILSRCVDLLPAGFCHPDLTRARLVVDKETYASEGYRDTPGRLSCDITVSGRTIGSLEVCYLDSGSSAPDGLVFTAEETFLVEAFAGRLERLIERQRVAARVRSDRERLETLWRIASMPDAEIRTIADHVLESMVTLAGCEYGFYGTVDEDESLAILHSWSSDVMAGCEAGEQYRHFPIPEAGLWAEAVRSRQPFIANDYSAEHPAKNGLPRGHVPLKNLMVVPVVADGRVRAVAALANKTTDFEADDVAGMTNFLSAAQSILDRRQAQGELREREWRLASILEATRVGTWEWNVQTGETILSDIWADLLGYTLRELAPVSIATGERLAHPDDLERARAAMQRHFEGEAPFFECDVRMRHKDGRWVWLQERGRVITHTDDGEPLMAFGTHTDISERKAAEEALSERNRFIDIVLEHSPIGFAVNTIDDNTALFVSSTFESIYGVEPGSITTVDEFFEKVYLDPVQREERRQRIIADMQSGDPLRMRWSGVPITTKTGEARFLDSTNIPVPEQNLMVSTVMDATERYRAGEALRESEEKFRSVVERASDGIAVIQDGRFVFANAAALKMTGYTFDDIKDLDFASVVAPASREAAVDRVARRLAGEQVPSTYEMEILRKDGTSLLAEVSAALIGYGGGPADLVVVRDVTERKRAEDALAYSHDLMQYIIEHDRSAVAVHDRDLNYIFVSQRYLEEYGITQRDVLGRHHYEVFPDLPERWRIVHQRVLAGEILSAEDDPYERADGTVEWTRWECRPWYESDGSIGGIIVYTEVVTERKKSEIRLIQYQERLRGLAAELVASGEREQRRLAVELHDGLGQVLAAAKMEAQALQHEVRGGSGDEGAQRLVRLLGESIAEVRSLTAQLAPTVLMERGLSDALFWLRDRYQELYGMQCDVRIDGDADSQGMETTMLVFRIVREALNNVVRHSGACEAQVTVSREECGTTVSVTDRGEGFDPATIDEQNHGGFGLFSIREECLARSGTFDVRSGPDTGTCVTACIPEDGAFPLEAERD